MIDLNSIVNLSEVTLCETFKELHTFYIYIYIFV